MDSGWQVLWTAPQGLCTIGLNLPSLRMEKDMDVILLMATTLDGKIARNDSQFVDWSGSADKAYFVKVTREAGVMIMGSKTYDTIGKPLPGRLNIVMTRDKGRVSDADNLVFTDQSPEEILKELEEGGFKSVVLIGGGVVNSLFADRGLITHMHITIVPRVFGTGLPLFNNELDMELGLLEDRELDLGHRLMIYKVMS